MIRPRNFWLVFAALFSRDLYAFGTTIGCLAGRDLLHVCVCVCVCVCVYAFGNWIESPVRVPFN